MYYVVWHTLECNKVLVGVVGKQLRAFIDCRVLNQDLP